MSLSTKQVDALLAPLHPGRVRQVQGNAHLEAWDIRRHLLRVFGWGGWDFEVISCDVVSERSVWEEKAPLKGRHSVVYRVVGRLVIRDAEGNAIARYEDGATGDGLNQPSIGDAHDMALKTAMSQALKRCAMNLGDRFGLSLYNGGSTKPVVGESLAHAHGASSTVSEDVELGEMSDRRDADSAPDAIVEVPAGGVESMDRRQLVVALANASLPTNGSVDDLRDRLRAALAVAGASTGPEPEGSSADLPADPASPPTDPPVGEPTPDLLDLADAETVDRLIARIQLLKDAEFVSLMEAEGYNLDALRVHEVREIEAHLDEWENPPEGSRAHIAKARQKTRGAA